MNRRTFHLWRVKDKTSNRWRTLDSKLTEPDALAWAQFKGLDIERAETEAPHAAVSDASHRSARRKAGIAHSR
jgi:hypothetical protein